MCEGESMDIYRVLCGILGADIFGERTVALDERECLDLADGSRLIKVRGRLRMRGEYDEICSAAELLKGEHSGIIRAGVITPVRLISLGTGSKPVFEVGMEAVYREEAENETLCEDGAGVHAP